MGCEPITFPGGSGWICSRGRRTRARCRCGTVAPYLCDGPSPTRRSGTCDAPICGACATEQGPEQHLCPECATTRTATSSSPAAGGSPAEGPAEPPVATTKPAAPLYALTLWPEWAWAICRLDKRVENRTWHPITPAPFWLAVHAGSRFGGEPDGTVYRPGYLRPVVEVARQAGWQTTPVRGRFNSGHGLYQNPADTIPMPPVGAAPDTRSIVAVCRVVALSQERSSPWHVAGAWGWYLDDLTVLHEPVPCLGRQGLWRVEGELLDRVREQWRAARAP